MECKEVDSLLSDPRREKGCFACRRCLGLVGDAVEKQKSQIGDARTNDPPGAGESDFTASKPPNLENVNHPILLFRSSALGCLPEESQLVLAQRILVAVLVHYFWGCCLQYLCSIKESVVRGSFGLLVFWIASLLFPFTS